MALMINENCTACDACVPECPNEAITAGNPMKVCPVDDCIVDNPDFRESQDELLAKYQSLHG